MLGSPFGTPDNPLHQFRHHFITVPTRKQISDASTIDVGQEPIAAGASGDADGLLSRADAALYAAKERGRDQVVCAAETKSLSPV